MRRRPKESERHVNALMTAVMILDCFRSTNELQLKDIHHRTGINKSRILRYVGSLEASGLMYFNEDTGSYHLGPKLYYLGRVLEKKYSSVIDAVRPVMDELETGPDSVAYFSIRYGFERLVLVRRQPSGVDESVIKDGQVRPLHLGANSSILLAYEKSSVLARIMEHFRSARSIALSEPQLIEMTDKLRRIRASGFAISYGETKPGFYVTSVPVLGRSGILVGALGLSTPGDTSDEAEARRQIVILTEAATTISASLERTMTGEVAS
ncbi:IclR family transcriptional regulator [Agaricicola taiwanensis]|uniref:IclR family transcriptional regulator n=1 Tax=Agaricicola taiwanensis TaxID=591372 RepID=A0A8J2VMA5_9RHOB|nr:IclR family transcriptional regulator C-terminal domain-containing protein [Agaricicola taiwanensis]GGE28441.1 IclR family transcriptional regulator [Agaricicola taiwanensis]